MNDSSAVRALLAASEPDGPRDHELCSVAFLAAAVQSHDTKRTDLEALRLVLSALCGFRAWAGLAPSQLTVYERGYLDRITPLCRAPMASDDGGPPLPSEFERKFKNATDMHAFFVVWADAQKAFDLPAPAPAAAVVQSNQTLDPAADPAAANQQQSGPDLEHIAAVYLREVGIRQRGAINRAAAKLKRLDGAPMGRTTLVKRLKEAHEAGIHTGYPPER